MSELKECPMCGGEAELRFSNDKGSVCITCKKCRCKTPYFRAQHTAHKAAWNTRNHTRAIEKIEAALIDEGFCASGYKGDIAATIKAAILEGE